MTTTPYSTTYRIVKGNAIIPIDDCPIDFQYIATRQRGDRPPTESEVDRFIKKALRGYNGRMAAKLREVRR